MERFIRRMTVGASVAAILGTMSLWSPVGVAGEAAGGAEDGLAEVTVTGSRIVRRDLDAASPIVTVTSQAFDESSTMAVESVLNQLPQYVPSATQFNTSDTFASATNTPGISTVNMRGLGANRTLVLVDGRRAQPANSTLVVDTNSIPSAALESVEIISGGASAVYGADALAGVTNFKLRSNFEGIDMQFRTGITEQGDGEETRVSMLLGTRLAGSGNAMLGVEYYERGEVLATDRYWYPRAIKSSQTNTGSNVRMNGFSYAPSLTNMSNAARAEFQAAANALYPERPAGYTVRTTTSFYVDPNDPTHLYKVDLQGLGFLGDIENDPHYKIQPAGTLVQSNLDLRYSSPATRYSLFGKANFSFNDHVEAWSYVNFVNTTNRQVLQPSPGSLGAPDRGIPHGSAIYGPSLDPTTGDTLAEYQAGGLYGLSCPATGGCTNSQAFPVPAELASLLDARGPNVFLQTGRIFDPVTGVEIPAQGADADWNLAVTPDFLPARTIENTTNLFQVTAGLRGDLGLGDWTWEAYISHGATRVDLDYIGFMSTIRLRRLLTSPNYGRGATLTGTGSSSLTCTSGMPVFGGSLSDDCVAAVNGNYTDRTRLTQDIIEATAQGGLFNLPAGQVRAALGVTYRGNEFQYMPDAIRETNNISDSIAGVFAQANVFGKITVREIYGELLVPVLSDKFLAKSLELELGYRFSDYGTAGNVPTWKALVSWEPLDWMRFRGGYQLANRAPNINELFLDASSLAITYARGAEPCRADTRVISGNNPANPNRAAVQALCEALIGNTTSTFSDDPDNYTGGRGDGVMLEVSSGNRNLKSEKGETWTAGVVFRSPFEAAAISNATLAIDWYKAKITDAIALVSATTTYDLCFNVDGTSNPTYSIDDPNGVCRNIQRDENSGASTQTLSTYANTGTLNTSGFDVSLAWRSAMADLGMPNMPGSLMFNLAYSKLLEFKAQEFAGGNVLENAGTLARGGLFDWRLNGNLAYSAGNWTVGLNWRHLPSVKSTQFVTDPTTTVQGTGSYDIFGLTGNWDINDKVTISGGVDNLFDREPNWTGAGQVFNIPLENGGPGTVISDGYGSTNAGYYDVLGRRYFVNVRLRF
ncbi:MAG: TonB-dependent receptor [Nevskiaceae bacterium]|nr:TonB-dependent receptor [Nevskiaceae bacterium]